MSYKSKEVLNSFAKLAADAFTGQKKTPLNDSLQKIASSEDLLPHQIEYVAAEANKAVWSKYYNGKKKEEAYSFEQADPSAITSALQTKPQEKVASVNMDYILPPGSMNKEASDKSVYGSFATEATANDRRKELRAELTERYEKLAMLREQLLGEMSLEKSAAENLEAKFIREARQMIISTPLTDRPEAMDKIAEFVRSTGHFKVGQALMQKLAQNIVKSGLVKEADLKAPTEYISETLPARVINGNHSLYITIDTIAKKYDLVSNYGQQYTIVDHTLPELKEKIRGL